MGTPPTDLQKERVRNQSLPALGHALPRLVCSEWKLLPLSYHCQWVVWSIVRALRCGLDAWAEYNLKKVENSQESRGGGGGKFQATVFGTSAQNARPLSSSIRCWHRVYPNVELALRGSLYKRVKMHVCFVFLFFVILTECRADAFASPAHTAELVHLSELQRTWLVSTQDWERGEWVNLAPVWSSVGSTERRGEEERRVCVNLVLLSELQRAWLVSTQDWERGEWVNLALANVAGVPVRFRQDLFGSRPGARKSFGGEGGGMIRGSAVPHPPFPPKFFPRPSRAPKTNLAWNERERVQRRLNLHLSEVRWTSVGEYGEEEERRVCVYLVHLFELRQIWLVNTGRGGERVCTLYTSLEFGELSWEGT